MGHTDAVTVLLALGADPAVADVDGYTPCMGAAIDSGSVPCLRALAAGGPGGALVGDAVNAVDSDGNTALDVALDMNHAEFAAVLRDELGGKRGDDL
jgi:ankyrin repeat protein